jgi:hypothetical protein
MILKIGSVENIISVVKKNVTPSVKPSVTSKVTQNVTQIPEGNAEFSGTPVQVEPLDKENFLYFWARAISAGETSGPNGNGDYFPLAELIKSYKTFIGRGLFLNHDSKNVEKSVGKIIDSQIVVDPETKEVWIECLCKVDKKLYPDICRKIETGVIDSVSMGCSCGSAVCSVCHKEAHTVEEFCDHLRYGLLTNFNVNGQEILCYSINKDINFVELSLVATPADSKAKIRDLIAKLKLNQVSNSKSEVNMEIQSGKTEEKEVKIKTTKEEQDSSKDPSLEKMQDNFEKVKTTKDEQDELKKVLMKLNASEYLSLLNFIEKKSSEKDLSNIERNKSSDYEQFQKVNDEIELETKKTKVDPELKDIKESIVSRKAGKIDDPKDKEMKNIEEVDLKEIKKKIIERLTEKISKLNKSAEAKEGGKEYYYMDGSKEPKPGFPSEKSVQYSSPSAGKDPTVVEEGKTTKDLEEQYKEELKKPANEWDKSREGVKKEIESENTIEKSKKVMGFAFDKGIKVFKVANKLGQENLLVFRNDTLIQEIPLTAENKMLGESSNFISEKIKESKEEELPEEKDASIEHNMADEKDYNAHEKKAKLNTQAIKSVVDNKEDKEMKPDTEAKKDEPKENKKPVKEEKKEPLNLDKLLKDVPAMDDKNGPKSDKKKEDSKIDELMNETPKSEKNDEFKEEKKEEFKFDKEEAPDEKKEEGMESKEGKETGTEKVIKKLHDLWDKFGIKTKIEPRKSAQPVYDYILNLLETFEKEVSPSKAEETKEKEKKIEAELAIERTRSALREKLIYARNLVEEMMQKGMIAVDESAMKHAQAEGKTVMESRKIGLEAAVNKQVSDLLKMDDNSLKAFADSIGRINVTASKKVLSNPINVPIDSNDDGDWIEKLDWQ